MKILLFAGLLLVVLGLGSGRARSPNRDGGHQGRRYELRLSDQSQ